MNVLKNAQLTQPWLSSNFNSVFLHYIPRSVIRTIIYISNAVKLFEERHLNRLFYQSVHNNTSNNITGILLYNEGTFIQILEGKEKALSDLFKIIHCDRRHNNITKILDRKIGERLFKKYRTGFSTLNNYGKLEVLETFLTNGNNSSHAHVVLALLNPFLNKRYTSMNVIDIEASLNPS